MHTIRKKIQLASESLQTYLFAPAHLNLLEYCDYNTMNELIDQNNNYYYDLSRQPF